MSGAKLIRKIKKLYIGAIERSLIKENNDKVAVYIGQMIAYSTVILLIKLEMERSKK